MRVWQIAGRVDELPKIGDWKQHRILDQSFVIVRGKDDKLRGFVNACRHRGNLLCNAAAGNAKRGFVCQYHLWSYDLDGRLRGMLRENLAGPVDKRENSLLEVPVDTFAGFIFINPDPNAQPLSQFLGPEVTELLAPYHLDEMVAVMDVREPLDCNWKVVLDAFEEGYHINGIHPQLLNVLTIDPATTRYRSSTTTVSRWHRSRCGAPAPRSRSRQSWTWLRHFRRPLRSSRVSRYWSPTTATRTGPSTSRTESPRESSCSRPPATP